MRTVVALALIALVAFSSSSYAAKNAGQDNGPDVEETPFESYTVTTPSVSGETWTLVVVMDEAHTSNNTTFEITSQICLNDGVCDPPVVRTLPLKVLRTQRHSHHPMTIRMSTGESRQCTKMIRPNTSPMAHGTPPGRVATTTMAVTMALMQMVTDVQAKKRMHLDSPFFQHSQPLD